MFDIELSDDFPDLGLDDATLSQLDALISNSTSKSTSDGRFAAPLTTSDFENKLLERIPKKTQSANTWSVKHTAFFFINVLYLVPSWFNFVCLINICLYIQSFF